MAEKTTTAVPSSATSSRRPPRPDKAKYEKEVEAIRAEISKAQDYMKEIESRFPSRSASDSASGKRNEIREKFNAQIQKVKEIGEKRSKIFDQINAIQANMKKKNESAKSEKDRLGVKTVAEAEARIASLEKEIASGKLSLMDEKRMVSEISNLNKARKVLEGHSSQSQTVESDKTKLETLREQIKAIDVERQAARSAADALRAELDKASEQLTSVRGNLGELVEKKKEAWNALQTQRKKLDEVRSAYHAANQEFYAWETEERKKRAESARQAAAEEREKRLMEQAQADLEAAEIPAFADEMNLCKTLIQLLRNQAGLSSDSASADASGHAGADVRKVESSMPAGATLVVRKADRDDDFMVLGKAKKGKRGGSASSRAGKKPLRLDIETVNQFVLLKVAIPTSTDDAPAAIAALEGKLKEFESNQAAQTAANKAAALERVAKLRASGDAAADAASAAEASADASS